MPHERPEPGSAQDWLRHAHSDLALCMSQRTGRVLSEALCFHAQQAAEKALKAVLVAHGKSVMRTHNIQTLLDQLPRSLLRSPHVNAAAALSDYAVEVRYPGAQEAVSSKDLRRARQMAQAVVRWAETAARTGAKWVRMPKA